MIKLINLMPASLLDVVASDQCLLPTCAWYMVELAQKRSPQSTVHAAPCQPSACRPPAPGTC